MLVYLESAYNHSLILINLTIVSGMLACDLSLHSACVLGTIVFFFYFFFSTMDLSIFL